MSGNPTNRDSESFVLTLAVRTNSSLLVVNLLHSRPKDVSIDEHLRSLEFA